MSRLNTIMTAVFRLRLGVLIHCCLVNDMQMISNRLFYTLNDVLIITL